MKKLNLLLIIAAFNFILSACTEAPESDKAKTSEEKEVSANASGETYKVDPSTSKVEWIGTKVTGYHTGTVQVKSGELQVKDGNIMGGNFVMDMTTLAASGPKSVDQASNTKLTGHLKSADFFEVTAHPDATFVVTEVKPFTGSVNEPNDPRQEEISEYKVTNPTHTVSGNLTIKGITKNIEFPARITIADNAVDAIAKFNVDRSQWKIVYPGKPDDLIRNDIHLGIALKATK